MAVIKRFHLEMDSLHFDILNEWRPHRHSSLLQYSFHVITADITGAVFSSQLLQPHGAPSGGTSVFLVVAPCVFLRISSILIAFGVAPLRIVSESLGSGNRRPPNGKFAESGKSSYNSFEMRLSIVTTYAFSSPFQTLIQEHSSRSEPLADDPLRGVQCWGISNMWILALPNNTCTPPNSDDGLTSRVHMSSL